MPKYQIINHKSYFPRKISGFTLIEMMISMVLMGVLAIGFYGIQQISGKQQIRLIETYLGVEDANNVLSIFVKTLRNSRPSDNGSYPIEKATAQEIIFYSDADFDGKTERVRYTLTESRFVQGLIEPVGIPAAYPSQNEKVRILTDRALNQSTPVFTYYNRNWPIDTINNPMVTPINLTEIKMIKIFLRIESADNKDFILQSSVQMRMTKDNL